MVLVLAKRQTMTKPDFPHKPPAPSVRETLSQSIARARGLPREAHPLTQQQIVRDILDKLRLPPSIQREWKERHGLE